MRDVDYVKLSELYASFLIAIGGVSMTVLSIVSAINPKGGQPTVQANTNSLPQPAEIISSFLSAALIVATVSCFIGAHMMAETAAFTKYFKEKLPKVDPPEVNPLKGDSQEFNSPKWDAQEWTPAESIIFGKRLFLLASTNIFIAVTLVLFALVLLPAAKVAGYSGLWIYFVIFVLVGIGALRWMFLASKHRMPLPKADSRQAIKSIGIISAYFLIAIIVLSFAPKFIRWFPLPPIDFLLVLTFLPSVISTGLSLLYFASVFKDSNQVHRARIVRRRRFIVLPWWSKEGIEERHPEVTFKDIRFFGCAVVISYASLVFAGFIIIIIGMDKWV